MSAVPALWNRQKIWLIVVGFTLCSFAFSQRINSIGILALVAFFLVDKNLLQKISKPLDAKLLVPFIGFFFIYFIFYLFSEKDNDAFQAMFIKMSFLLLPLLFYYESFFTASNEQKLMQWFSVLLCISFAYSIGHSMYKYYFLGVDPSIYGVFNRMSISEGIMHPGYFSNFFMFAFLWHYYHSSRHRLFFMSAFIVILLLLLSRIVLLFFILFIFWQIFNWILSTSKPILSALLIGMATLLISAGLYQLKTVKYRVDETIAGLRQTDKNVAYSAATASRKVAYEEEFKLCLDKPLFGYGLGNANQALQQGLHASGFKTLAENMHAHNQFFNTWLQTGIIGLAWLVVFLLTLIIRSIKNANVLAFWFTILVTMNLVTDDMLEIQAGIVFFVLIWSLYIIARPNRAN